MEAQNAGVLTFQDLAHDVFTEYGYDVVINLVDKVAPGTASVMAAKDVMSDSGLYGNLDTKRSH